MRLKDLYEASQTKTCDDVTSIRDINDQFDYDDEHPKGEGDSPEVACGQANGYNELKYIYNSKLKNHVVDRKITKEQALKALCCACHDLENPRQREDFYQHLSNTLGIDIS
ncbi:hypothetical protein [Halomonas sp. HG01]|uniref:hypothetical protein n=1 Tax=Halomonas sp. HG01 TaxID=1609967 RepID=UPI0009E43192|nr:hypothetical protein [Halomonas sp. HG01]